MNRRFTSFRKTKAVCQSRVTLKTTVFFCYVHYCASRAHSHPQSPKLQPPALSYQLERNKGLGTRLFTWLLNRWSKVTTGALDYVIVLNLLPKVLSLRLRTLGMKVMVAMSSTVLVAMAHALVVTNTNVFCRIFTPPIRNNFFSLLHGKFFKVTNRTQQRLAFPIFEGLATLILVSFLCF